MEKQLFAVEIPSKFPTEKRNKRHSNSSLSTCCFLHRLINIDGVAKHRQTLMLYLLNIMKLLSQEQDIDV